MKRVQDEPTDFDYKFAEMAIDAQYAIYEETGQFPWSRQLERLADDLRRIREEKTGLPIGSLASERFVNNLKKRKGQAKCAR